MNDHQNMETLHQIHDRSIIYEEKILIEYKKLKTLNSENLGAHKEDINNENCLYNVINAVKANNYPINISNIPYCDKSLFNDKDIVINKNN